MNKKHLIFLAKLLLMLAVFAFVAVKLKDAWHGFQDHHVAIDWRFAPIALAALAANMLASALVWRWLAKKMGHTGHTTGLLAAYTFSQMGKYIPGKVALLLMRIDRAARYAMPTRTTTLSTLLENMLYLISGGLTGMIAIAHVATGLDPTVRPFIWPFTIAAVVALAAGCQPKIFYGFVNRVLARMKRPLVPTTEQLAMPTLILAIIGFLPCWLFGGIAMWAATGCVHTIDPSNIGWFAGAFALSVIIGMISLLPAGIGIRELVLGAAITLQLAPAIGHDKAAILALVAVSLQRLFQLLVEVFLGLAGMAITSLAKPKPTQPTPNPA